MQSSLSTLAVLTLASLAFAHDDKPERFITVSGTATVYAKPDTARIFYGVKVTEPTADAVKEVLAKHSKAIDDSVKKLKIGTLSITTGPLGLKQASNQNVVMAMVPGGAPAAANPGLGPFTGHTAQTATITNADPEKLRADIDTFLKSIIDAGANTNGAEPKEESINFFPGQGGGGGPKVVLARADESAARGEAFQAAVERAVKNAKAIAKGLGAIEVKVVSVTDEAEKPVAEALNIYGLESPSAARSPAGEIEVKVRVIVKCTF